MFGFGSVLLRNRGEVIVGILIKSGLVHPPYHQKTNTVCKKTLTDWMGVYVQFIVRIYMWKVMLLSDCTRF